MPLYGILKFNSEDVVHWKILWTKFPPYVKTFKLCRLWNISSLCYFKSLLCAPLHSVRTLRPESLQAEGAPHRADEKGRHMLDFNLCLSTLRQFASFRDHDSSFFPAMPSSCLYSLRSDHYQISCRSEGDSGPICSHCGAGTHRFLHSLHQVCLMFDYKLSTVCALFKVFYRMLWRSRESCESMRLQVKCACVCVCIGCAGECVWTYKRFKIYLSYPEEAFREKHTLKHILCQDLS